MNDLEKIALLRIQLMNILDQVDYTHGACRVNEMVGAVLPKNIIEAAHEALKITKWIPSQ
jgi:hypothetical protein